VTLRGRRNTIENVESGLAVHLAGRVKQVAVRINTSPASHLLRPQEVRGVATTTLMGFLGGSYSVVSEPSGH